MNVYLLLQFISLLSLEVLNNLFIFLRYSQLKVEKETVLIGGTLYEQRLKISDPWKYSKTEKFRESLTRA